MSLRRRVVPDGPPVGAQARSGALAEVIDRLAWRRRAVFGRALRDTDADWTRIGAQDPYWGVLTDAKYRRDNLDPAAVEAFYASGVSGMEAIVAELERATGAPVRARSALDFGCGVGRLAEAMGRYAGAVTGLDVSEPMLEIARARGATVRYADTLPDERFDWINSFIVFQHIPPKRGLGLLEQLLGRLEPNGLVSLQLTVWRELHLRVPRGFAPPPGEIMMYDYDLGAVLELLSRNGVERFAVVATNHGGHHGVHIYGRRSAAPDPQS